MKIAIDIDDVLVEFVKGYFEFLKTQNYNVVDLKEVFSYNLWEVLGISKEEAFKLGGEFLLTEEFDKMDFVEGAIEGVRDLIEFSEVFFITARPKSFYNKTINFIKENFGVGEDRIFFAMEFFAGKTKEEICSELEISLIVEDNGEYSLKYAEKGLKVLLLDKPWNKNVEHKNIFRCKNWDEILEKIKGFDEGEKDFVKLVRDFVECECRKESSKYGYDIVEFHFVPVVKYAGILAKEFGLDEEMSEIAGWLHDIGSIIYGREEHHITGAKIAEEKLLELNYPLEKIEIIKKCVLNHRGSQESEFSSVYEKVIADADALGNFENISGIIKAAVVYEGKTQSEAKKEVLKKLTNKYNKLSFDYSKKIIEPKMKAVKLLFGEENGG